MAKTIIAPLVALFVLILNTFFHVSISDNEQLQIVEGLVLLASIGTVFWGIIINHKKNPQ